MARKSEHTHLYDIHPSSDWARTHAACSICGMAAPFDLVRYALEHGAQATNALREWMANA